ncbi:PKD domain-containing protein, partial [Winogradskyella sp.]
MKQFLTLFSLVFSSILLAQDVNMQTATVNQCGGTFYDSGGEFGNYSDNENFVLTICPENAGQKIQLNFTSFSTQLNQDILSIFNGDSTAEPLFGDFSGGMNPGLVEATQDNTSGCITIQFVSNGSGNIDGWEADISCLTPCQTINSQIDSASPAPNGDGYIRVCPNEDITLTGGGTFSVDGTGATYEWDLGDGNTVSGQTATFSYATPGVYIVNLNIRDTNTSQDPEGCTNNNLINQVIQVATEPDFTGTAAAESTLCFGESTTIDGVVTPTEFINDCTPPVSGVTFLPDGNGVTYETSVTVDCYDSAQTLTDVNQLVSICLNMEHSYLGDLDIEIISPNGQVVRMHDQGGGSANLGIPWATGGVDGNSANTTPGTGYDYCFVPNGGFPTLVGGVQTGGTFPNGDGPGTYTDSFVPAGSYSSVNPLDGLIGSPLNGDWTIRVVDNIGLDNGHIFSWSIEFDPNLQPPELSFTPVITSEAWDPDPTITNTAGNVITVAPSTSGQFCYTYRVTDDFGCEYTEQVCIDVLPEIVTETPNNLFVCDTGAPPYIFDLETNTAVVLANATNIPDLVVTYHNSQADADADVAAITGLNNYSGTDGEVIYIRVEYLNSGCYEVLPFTLNVAGQPDINPVPDLVLCDDPSNDGFEEFVLSAQTLGILGAQSETDFNVTYHLSFADADANTGVLPLNYTNTVNPQPIYVRVENIGDSSCYNASANPVFNLVVDPREDASFNVNPTCDGTTVNITGDTGGTFTFNPVPTDAAVIDPNSGLVTGGTSGATYTIEYTTSGTCPSTSAQTFTVISEDDASFTVTPNCDGGTATITGDVGGTFSFNPAPADATTINPNTGEVTNATPGDSYTIEYVTSGTCPSSSTQILTVLSLDDPSFTLNPTCDGATATVTGDTGGIFVFDPLPADSAMIDANTGTITNGVSGTTYTVEYTTAGDCPQSSIQNVTVTTSDDASFTVSPTCDGGTVTINGTTGGTFGFDLAPTDGAVIDVNTGEVTSGTSGASYTISYTTSGVCPDTEIVTFNALPIDDASFTVEPTCDGGTVTISGTAGGTFNFNPVPIDGAVIDVNTGNVTNGTPGETYSIEYFTSGTCPNSSIVQFTANPLPSIVPPTPLEVCDDGTPDGFTEIDLTLKNTEVTGNSPGYTVSYHIDLADA